MNIKYQWLKNGLPLLIAIAPGVASASPRSVSSLLQDKRPVVLAQSEMQQVSAPQENSFSAFGSPISEFAPTAVVEARRQPLEFQPLNQHHINRLLKKNSSSGQAGSRFDGVKVVGDAKELIQVVGNCTTSSLSGNHMPGMPGICYDNSSITCTTDADCSLSLTISDVTMNEGNSGTTTFTHTVELNFASSVPTQVNYATSDVTATAGSDYTAASGTVTIPTGQRTATINITVHGDELVEPDETYHVTLSGPINSQGSVILNKHVGVGTILNDDVAPAVNSVSVPLSGTYGAGQNLDFTVNASKNLTVNTASGIPFIELTIGSDTRYATYTSGSGTSALLFRYTIVPGDMDADGIEVSAAINLNSGTIRDAAGNNITTTLNSVGNTSAVLVSTNIPPVNTVAPSVSGTPTVGNALSATDGTWTDADGDPLTYSRQWYRADDASGTNLVAIGGATNSSYTLTTSDAHKYLRVVVTANDGNGGTTPANSPYTQITNSAPVNTVAPSVSGTATVGNALSTTNGSWTDADGDSRTYSYQWYRADDNSGTGMGAIGGATGSSYILTTLDAHKYIRVVVTANDGYGGNTSANSIYTQVTNSAPVNTVAPTVTGTATVGGTLSTTSGTWTDADGDSRTYSYQWYRADNGSGANAVAIGGATASSYTLTTSDARKFLRVTVTANDGNGGTPTADSAYTAVTNVAPTDVTLSNTNVNQSGGANAVVGALSSVDPDGDTSFTYSLVTGAGDTDNASFNINGASLRASDAATLTAGVHSIRVQTDDGAGGAFAKAFSITVIDDVAPTLNGVSFEQSSVTAANQSALSLSLAGAEVGTTASYSITSSNGGTAVTASGLAVSSAAQQFTGINVSGLNDGTLTVSLTLMDLANNESSAVTNTINKDTNVPVVSSVGIANGHYAAGGIISINLTLDDDVTVSGTNSTLAIDIGGSTRQAVFVSEDNGVLLYQYTVQANENTDGVGVVALANGLSLNGDTIRDAGNNDANLNYAQFSNADAQVDTTAPEAASITAPAAPVSVNADDYIISGTHNENGVTVKLYLDANNDGVPDHNLVLDSVIVVNGAWSLTAPLLANSDNNFVIIIEDAAGNNSEAVNVPTITEDSIAPDTPAVPVLSATSDTGVSDSDGITSNTTPVLSGTAEPDSTVTLTSDKDGDVGTVVADSSGNWSITATTLSDGVHNLSVAATDAAGNISDASTALEITIDTTAPVLSAIANQSLVAGAGSGALAVTLSDEVTDASSLTLTADSSDLTVIPLANLILGGTDANRSVTVTSTGQGLTTITLTAEDEAGNTGTTSFTVMVAAPNAAPVISGTPATSVNQDTAYSFVPTATDVDVDDVLTFSITNKPSWASFDPATGRLSGIPVKADVGVTTGIVISVSDGALSASLPPFNLEVVNVNEAPVISGTPATSVNQDTAYNFIPTATDVDVGDVLNFSITNKPSWAAFDAATGALTGTPVKADVGVTTGIVISVSDGALSASLPAFNLTVTSANSAPVISGTPSTTIEPGNAYNFTPTASDPDGDALTFSITNKPSWAAFNSTTGRLSGTPSAADEGTYSNIRISVSDGTLSASLPAFTIAVSEAVDPSIPVVTAPSAVTLNASALYTPVTLRQLLKLGAEADSETLQAALAALTSGGGEACCTTLPEGLNDNGVVMLAPGRHEVVWTAVAGNGKTASAKQTVNIRPLVSFAKNQQALRDSVVSVRILLNGVSPVYPLAIPVTIDTATTAAETEYTLVETVAMFNDAGQTEARIDVQLHAGSGSADSQLVLGLDDRSSNPAVITGDLFDINSGAANRHTITLREGNIAPEVSLTLNQDERNTIIVARTGGDVTVMAQVTDLNPGDTHSFDWSGTDNLLADIDGNTVNNTLVFNPAALNGRYYVQLTVTDSAGASETADLYFRVVEQLPELDPNKDSNGNGIDDATEGFGDANGNGIPDYLDAMPTDNVLPQQIIEANAYLLECDPGVLCRIGRFALMGESGGVELLDNDFTTLSDLSRDTTHKPVGGIFDFDIKHLPVEGQTIRVVIPQREAIPAEAVYRKYHNGTWKDFVSNDSNQLHSAPGNPGFCPPPGDAQWESGLIAGYLCVQLTLEDGGPNDADGLVNKAIADPGVVSVRIQTEPPVDPEPEPEPPVNPEPPVKPEPPKGKKSSGAFGLMETGAALLLLLLAHNRRRSIAKKQNRKHH